MSTNEALLTLEGWYTYHNFRTINWEKWKAASAEERQAALDELFGLIREWEANEQEKQGSTAIYSILGHKADLVFLFLRPTMQELDAIKTAFNKTRFAAYTEAPYSYISVVELSNYVHNPGEDPKSNPQIRERLYPILPKWEHICFYPMNKKRNLQDNWYMLTMEQRAEMMRSHGMIGRKYAGKVKQIIGGSVGFDDWEWGVTLFANDPLEFKHIVYEMRFDEVSARYGEFGNFLVGNIVTPESLTQMLQV
ncbi:MULTISPECIES: hydrogen peroxide-dependent heme synthase [Brevibacillus]|uniref:Coproheme decarboxylase n=1 Tax=Brevibacillus aydinogluensis TaxID=927786 RepID=A0AA48RG88_9BACL|nr:MULTISPECIES: hydrogen peroxide-dependent heme synthase [Brevibacillus]MBR8658726.1 heme-dependent peroxidase [Brevibacillus sp. NL20B1]NNV03030.1 heme-dependent peroxidase [Brevibacillus sp. MCWH]CAJ1001525.1 heme-dependent peroxidase [Brevibacillus aydinogluensis]